MSRRNRKRSRKKKAKDKNKHKSKNKEKTKKKSSEHREREHNTDRGHRTALAEFKARQRRRDSIFVVIIVIFALSALIGFYAYEYYLAPDDDDDSELDIVSQDNSDDENSIPTNDNKEINWVDYNDGMALASAHNLPVIIDFYTDWCGPCNNMDAQLYPDSRVIEKSKSFIMIKVNGDYNSNLMDQYDANSYPTIVFLDSNQHEVDRWVGWGYDVDNQIIQFLDKMDSTLS